MASKIKKYLLHLYYRYGFGLWMVVYVIVYLLSFTVLEKAGHRHYHVIHTWLDDQIPFCEYFIIPYTLWFAYLVAAVCFFIFVCKDKNECYRLTAMLSLGMTVFIVTSVVYPNMQDLRPEYFARDNIFVRMVQMLYKTDTPTNVLPSIHVFNTLAITQAFHANVCFRKRRWLLLLNDILAASIVLSTMFLKQHSVIDVALGIMMSLALQIVCDRMFVTESERAIDGA